MTTVHGKRLGVSTNHFCLWCQFGWWDLIKWFQKWNLAIAPTAVGQEFCIMKYHQRHPVAPWQEGLEWLALDQTHQQIHIQEALHWISPPLRLGTVLNTSSVTVPPPMSSTQSSSVLACLLNSQHDPNTHDGSPPAPSSPLAFYVSSLEWHSVRWGEEERGSLHLHLGPRSRAIDRLAKFSGNDAALDQLVQSEGSYLSRRRGTH